MFIYLFYLSAMNSYKVVTPVKTGVQGIYNYSKRLDSGFRRNDRKVYFLTFYETIIYLHNNYNAAI